MGIKTNKAEFSADLRAIAVASFAEAGEAVRQLALQGLANLTQETPVDTGRARANWQVSIDTPAQGTLFDDTESLRGARIALQGAKRQSRKVKNLIEKRRKRGSAFGPIEATTEQKDADKEAAKAARAFGAAVRGGAAASMRASLTSGGAAIGRFDVGQHGSIWIVNNLPYINRLNEGWSKQNTPGWIERAMQAALAGLRK